MKQTAIFPGRYVQAEDALGHLGEEVVRLGRSALILAGGTAEQTIIPPYLPAWRERFEAPPEFRKAFVASRSPSAAVAT